MLTIRQAQLDHFAAQATARFVSRLLRMLGENFPTRCAGLSDGALQSLVERAIEEGPDLGVESEQEIAYLCALRLHFGETFPAGPGNSWVHEDVPPPDSPAHLNPMEALWQRAAPHLPE